LGLKVVAKCECAKNLRAEGISGFKLTPISDPSGPEDLAAFTFDGVAASGGKREIFERMMKSPRTFKNAEGEWINWQEHVKSRYRVASHARKAHTQFDFPSNRTPAYWNPVYWYNSPVFRRDQSFWDAIRDYMHFTRYSIGCQDAARMVFVAAWASLIMDKNVVDGLGHGSDQPLVTAMNRFARTTWDPASTEDDWVPGDWGYIERGGEVNDATKKEAARNGISLHAYAGENMIYLGAGEFWGHGAGIKSFAAFMQDVRDWGTAEPTLTKQRTFPNFGLE
jgi:hypothetical protein